MSNHDTTTYPIGGILEGDELAERMHAYYHSRPVREAPPPGRPTWEDLIAASPDLAELERSVPSLIAGVRCGNVMWYGYYRWGHPGVRYPSVRDQLIRLVGDHAPDDAAPVLCTSAAYDVAYDHLYQLMPDCDHEDPCGGNDSIDSGTSRE